MIIAILIYCLVVAAIAAGATYALARWRPFLDMPNHRSSHALPTPRGGGLGILIAVALGLIALRLDGHPAVLRDPAFLGVALGGLIASLAGLADDIRSRSFLIKMAAQVLAAAIAMALGLVIETLYIPGIGPIHLGWFGPLLTLLWMVGLTNAYNFMDGIDGLAGGTAVIAAFFLTIAMIDLRAIDESAVASTIGAACIGFLVFNIPPARIFMGDVGSQLLGFMFAALGVLFARHDTTGTLIYVVPLLLFHFIFDTVFTALRRWQSGENVALAHRAHLYQRMTLPGGNHGRTTTLLCLFTIAQGGAALWMIAAPAGQRLWIFIPALVLQIIYAIAVARCDRSAAAA
jgi:UDP-GlcNAc:undecaprenyl-phosphate GlcNAc-1-phosphate transferase